MKKLTLSLSVAALGFLAGCDKGTDSNSSETALSNRASYTVQHQSSLAQSLPSKTMAYFRVPNFVGMLNAPQGDALYPAISDKTIQSQATSIIEGINVNLLSKIEDPQIREFASLFVNKQMAPIEVAILAGIGGALTPEFILQTKLNLASNDELTRLLEQVASASQGQLQLSEAPNEEGNFRLAAGPISTFGYFDSASKNLVIYGGPTVIESTLKKYREGKLEKREDLMAFEQRFDASGAGLAAWADTETLWQQLSPMAPPEMGAELQKFNIQDTKFVYFGSGAKDGHGSMRLHLQYKEDGDNLLHFPTSSATLDVPVALPVNFVASLPMINQQHMGQAIKLDKRLSETPSLDEAVQQASQFLQENHQLELNKLLSAFGGSALLVSDKAGTWATLPIQDASSFDTMIAASQEKLGATLDKTTVAGTEITHYVFPGLTKLALSMAPDDVSQGEIPEPLMQLLAGENMHLYWVREGENLIVASLPQVLLARERHKGSTTITQWLNKNSITRDNSLLSMVASADDLPKTAYHMYLAGIQSLSDVAGVNPNLSNMPLAEDLGLADSGRIGLALNTGKTTTSLTLEYEQSPMDYLMGGNAMATVAVVGILAAVAIPAYQDYTVRAKASEALLSASQLRTLVAEHYITHTRLPNAQEAQEFVITTNTAEIFYDAKDEVIKIVYLDSAHTRLAGTELQLVPDQYDSGYVDWTCVNVSAPEALIPSSCRN